MSNWTTTPPSEPGWYWYMYPSDKTIEPVKVQLSDVGLEVLFIGWEVPLTFHECGGWWSTNPITPPKDEL
jgi:hypothetical protein